MVNGHLSILHRAKSLDDHPAFGVYVKEMRNKKL
jgi:hypothetical protein